MLNKNQKSIIKKVYVPKIVSEGVGVNLYRVFPNDKISIEEQDPFLLLDFFSAKLPSGFPDHPHRGFETLTYIIEGKMLHEDFNGGKGSIEEGGLQWMVAGKGIAHSEIPFSHDIPTVGFQLWINLAQKNKYVDPYYLNVKKESIPIVQGPNSEVKVISGEYKNAKGPAKPTSNTVYLYVTLHSQG